MTICLFSSGFCMQKTTLTVDLWTQGSLIVSITGLLLLLFIQYSGASLVSLWSGDRTSTWTPSLSGSALSPQVSIPFSSSSNCIRVLYTKLTSTSESPSLIWALTTRSSKNKFDLSRQDNSAYILSNLLGNVLFFLSFSQNIFLLLYIHSFSCYFWNVYHVLSIAEMSNSNLRIASCMPLYKSQN